MEEGTYQDGSDPELRPHDWDSSFKARLFKKDGKRFRKYIESTTTHGVVRIFTGKSKIRRVYWMIIVIGAAFGCLFNIVDRIAYLISDPTSTTISVSRRDSLPFPTVTVCNLNFIRRSYLQSLGLDEVLGTILNDFGLQDCSDKVDFFTMTDERDEELDFKYLTSEGRPLFELFMVKCLFQGVDCFDLPDDPWTFTLTRLGLCYIFNSDGLLSVNGTDPRQGVQLVMNIQQEEYISSSSGDAGVKLAIHTPGTPGEPDDIGIAVPPGRNAFISLRQRLIDDGSSNSDCKESHETDSFDFLQNEYNYSPTACERDCLLRTIAERCGCVETGLFLTAENYTGRFDHLPSCGEDHLCCLIGEHGSAIGCGTKCPPLCSYTDYVPFVSYSAFPADYLLNSLIAELELLQNRTSRFNFTDENSNELESTEREIYEYLANVTIDQEYLENNILSINIYFEELSIEMEVTEDSYSFSALLSDIGGQLGLFIGASVISMCEFFQWIFDELKDRCCGMSERKISRYVKVKKKRVGVRKKGKVLRWIRPPPKDVEMGGVPHRDDITK